MLRRILYINFLLTLCVLSSQLQYNVTKQTPIYIHSLLTLWYMSLLFECMSKKDIHIKFCVDRMVYFLNVLIHTSREYTHDISVYLMVDVLTVVMHLYGVYILNAS